MPKIKLAVIDEHELTRKAIVQSIKAEENLEVTHEAQNGLQFIEQLKTILPDIILMEAKMVITEGLDIIDHLNKSFPNLGIVVYTQDEIVPDFVEMNIHHVRSFIEKANDEELLKAVRIVHAGGVYMAGNIDLIFKEYLTRLNKRLPISDKEQSASRDTLNKLPEIERNILGYLFKGYTSSQIGARVFLSKRTVEKHIGHIYQKFQVNHKYELLEKVYRFLVD